MKKLESTAKHEWITKNSDGEQLSKRVFFIEVKTGKMIDEEGTQIQEIEKWLKNTKKENL